jgi:hypothetical protein
MALDPVQQAVEIQRVGKAGGRVRAVEQIVPEHGVHATHVAGLEVAGTDGGIFLDSLHPLEAVPSAAPKLNRAVLNLDAA